jgi:hypothetical protein
MIINRTLKMPGNAIMLIELYLLETYFEEPAALMFEEDMVRRFGAAAVTEAVAIGLLEQRRIPCGLGAAQGQTRHVCRLSQTGHALVSASLDHQ